MELLESLKKAYDEVHRSKTPKGPPLLEARKQLGRIDFIKAEIYKPEMHIDLSQQLDMPTAPDNHLETKDGRKLVAFKTTLQIPGGLSHDYFDAYTLASHVLKPTTAGIDLIAAVTKLKQALHAHSNLPEEGRDLRDATTSFLKILERSRGLGKRKRR